MGMLRMVMSMIKALFFLPLALSEKFDAAHQAQDEKVARGVCSACLRQRADVGESVCEDCDRRGFD